MRVGRNRHDCLVRRETRSVVYRRIGKRAIDVAVASVALVVASPALAGTAVAVKHKLGSPVLFRQTRPGLDGQPFDVLKFRTMTDERDEHGALLPDAVRLTAFGRVLRSTSLDELPELLNIVRGDMSLVGPRPLLMEYLPLYNARQSTRHDVRPGLTGLAQVNGRNHLSWEQKLELDAQYVESVSLRLDAAILWKTVVSVIRRTGITEAGGVTMSPFRGSGEEAES